MPKLIKQKVYVLEFFQNIKPININNIDFC